MGKKAQSPPPKEYQCLFEKKTNSENHVEVRPAVTLIGLVSKISENCFQVKIRIIREKYFCKH